MADTSASEGGRFRDLRSRAVSSVVIGTLAVAALWYDALTTTLLAAAAAAAMMWEWRTIVAVRPRMPGSGLRAVDLGFVLVAILLPVLAYALSAEVAVFVLLLAIGGGASILRTHSDQGAWSALGLLFIGLSSIGFVFLRGVEPFGLLSILLVGVVVVAADVGGYFAGRLIGGPKLWPRVSPAKTWAGLVGGLTLAALVGGIFSWATTGTYYYQVCTVSAIAALFAQSGDLAESAFKRHFGVKDASRLIPGHGGVLDRLDSHMSALLVASGVTFLRDAPIFVW